MASAIAAIKRFVAAIRTRLLLINVIVAAVPLVGFSFAELHERQLLAALERDMIHQAALLRAIVIADSVPVLGGRGPALAIAARDTRTRIRVLDAKGVVVSDSHGAGPPEGPERAVPHFLGEPSPTHVAEIPKPVELASRSEVQRALAGKYGAATRLWENQDRVYLFAALPIMRDGKTVDGVVYVTRSTRDVKIQLFQLRASLVKFMIVSVGATALISLLLAMTIARPLGRLTKRAQRIAARQPVQPDDLDTRRDEIGQLARAVGAMTDELERRAREARTLAADISHEFKTPLTGIRGAAELLRDGGAADDPETRERFLGMIVDDADRLARLVSRLLELARVEDDRGTALPVDLKALARACATRTWTCPVDVSGDDGAIANGRTGALTAAIDNLVANAAQHADAGTRVTIAIARRDERLRITVHNHGPALSASARSRVWDRFYSTRAHAGGSGLGLAIVRSVALAHDGAYGVDCADGITRFWFEVASV